MILIPQVILQAAQEFRERFEADEPTEINQIGARAILGLLKHIVVADDEKHFLEEDNKKLLVEYNRLLNDFDRAIDAKGL